MTDGGPRRACSERGTQTVRSGPGPKPNPGPKPEWLKKRLPDPAPLRSMETLLRKRGLHTVCESALCPNLGECFARGTATFLIMGDVCTRDCRFCGVTSAIPGPLDPSEPAQVADATARLGLRHVVITSVTRDDLPDGGSGHYVATIKAVRAAVPSATVEVLVPDFAGDSDHIEAVLAERPDVFNHNVETVPRLYPTVRPRAVYRRSLSVLEQAVGTAPEIVVKTGIMVGLGEDPEEVREVIANVRDTGVDVMTIGQYLRPSSRHLPVAEYVHPDRFEEYALWGEKIGLQIHAAPFVRSSFHAGESLEQLRRRRDG